MDPMDHMDAVMLKSPHGPSNAVEKNKIRRLIKQAYGSEFVSTAKLKIQRFRRHISTLFFL